MLEVLEQVSNALIPSSVRACGRACVCAFNHNYRETASARYHSFHFLMGKKNRLEVIS
jgi:hypothetical protein